jgi:polyisoprenyl-phosphate glycosyltransferase
MPPDSPGAGYSGSQVTPEYSFVIPVYNERENLSELHRRLSAVMDRLDGTAEVVLVDDRSTDGSFDVMASLAEQDARVRVIRLSRNFGHQIAITAGLDHARGNATIVMDADLQDPPEVALELAKRWREGFEVVYAVRDDRAGETRAKLLTASWFYRLLGRLTEFDIPAEVGDFRLVDRRALEAMGPMREHRRYLRGMFAWVGFNQTGVHYSREPRHAGVTKYPFRKMLRFALDGIVSFSTVPLRLTLNLGFFVSVISFLLGFAAILLKAGGVYAVPGWASIVVVLLFLGGAQLIVLGVIGEYLAHIHEEVKQRPLYLVSDVLGASDDGPLPPAGVLGGEITRSHL